MAKITLRMLAGALGNPSLQGGSGSDLSLKFLPDAYNYVKCANTTMTNLVCDGTESTQDLMRKFVTGNQQRSRYRGYSQLTQSLLDNLQSKTISFKYRDGTDKFYYESVRENIQNIAYDPNHVKLTAESPVWKLLDILNAHEAQVFKNIATVVSKKRTQNSLRMHCFC